MRRRTIKSPAKRGILTREQIREAVRKITRKATMDLNLEGIDKYIKIGRIGKMELRISIDVQKVDNGFILFKDIYGLKLQAEQPENGREVYVTFPEVRARIIELLQTIADQLAEAIPEKK